VQVEEGDKEPGAHFADEHLQGLDDGLLKESMLAGIGIAAIAHADVVLAGERGSAKGNGRGGGGKERTYLVFSQESVADAGGQHQRH
jgi:hypothetical protein